MAYENDNLLTVTSSPHIRSKRTTQRIMLDVIIALVPALAFSVYRFGVRALMLTVISVFTCVLCEELFCRIVRRQSTVYVLSAVVTGFLVAFNVPVTLPMWMLVLGDVFAIVVAKMLFGGIGQNFINPALSARVFMFLSFPSYMQPTNGVFSEYIGKLVNADVVASATPLTQASQGTAVSLQDMFIGNINGVLGEVSALCLLVGGIYLIARRVISWHIPVSFLATAAIISLIVPSDNFGRVDFMLVNLLGGGLILGALFMATDYSTSPVTPVGKIIFGVGCGAITMLIRLFSSNTEGVSFAILIMNLLVYYIDRFTMPKPFGTGRKDRAGKAEKRA